MVMQEAQAPPSPLTPAPPYEVGPETFVIPDIMPVPGIGVGFINSMVIRAQEPVIVDTGAPISRDSWLQRAFELVDPADVKWVFLTHDDRDHAGNIVEVLEACPNATLISTFFMFGRMIEEFAIDPSRVTFLYDTQRFPAGDRELLALRPPIYDNPTTRGLFDTKTGVYWSVDCFSAFAEGVVFDAAEIPEERFAEGVTTTAQLLSPWHQLLDEAKFAPMVQRVRDLGASAIATCHGPALYGERIEQALELISTTPSFEPFSEPSMEEFAAALAQAMAGAGVDD